MGYAAQAKLHSSAAILIARSIMAADGPASSCKPIRTVLAPCCCCFQQHAAAARMAGVSVACIVHGPACFSAACLAVALRHAFKREDQCELCDVVPVATAIGLPYACCDTRTLATALCTSKRPQVGAMKSGPADTKKSSATFFVIAEALSQLTGVAGPDFHAERRSASAADEHSVRKPTVSTTHGHRRLNCQIHAT